VTEGLRKGPQNVLAKEGANLPFERMTPDPLHFESLFWEESWDWRAKLTDSLNLLKK
jgi:hypothetical protein